MNHQNKQQLDQLLKQASEKLGSNPEAIKKAVGPGTVDKLMSSMSEADTQRLKSILADEEATKAILSSPQAQALLKKLSGQK